MVLGLDFRRRRSIISPPAASSGNDDGSGTELDENTNPDMTSSVAESPGFWLF
jgi:hypothetical protein